MNLSFHSIQVGLRKNQAKVSQSFVCNAVFFFSSLSKQLKLLRCQIFQACQTDATFFTKHLTIDSIQVLSDHFSEYLAPFYDQMKKDSKTFQQST